LDTQVVTSSRHLDTVWFTTDNVVQGLDKFEFRASAQMGCDNYAFDSVVTLRSEILPFVASDNQWTRKGCSQNVFPVVFSTPFCSALRIDSLLIDSLLASPLDWHESLTISENSVDTLLFSINPQLVGDRSYDIKVKGVLLAYGTAYDTTIHLHIHFNRDPSFQPASSPSIITVSNCDTSRIPIVLRSPCDSIVFTSCTLSVPNFEYDSTLNFPLRLEGNKVDTFNILFPPQDLGGSYTLFAKFRGYYPGTSISFDSTVSVRVRFTSAKNALTSDADAFDLNTITACETTDTTVFFKNEGCDTVIVNKDKTVWQPGWTAIASSFPIYLPPDSGFFVRIHIDPNGKIEHVTQHVSYEFDSRTVSGQLSSDVSLTINISAGLPAIALDTTPIEFGTVTTCETKSLPVVIASTGCDSLRNVSYQILKYRVEGTIPVALSSGTSDTLSLTLAPRTTGDIYDTLVITSNAGTKRIALHGTAIAAPVQVALASTSLTLPEAIAGCTSDTAIIALTNKSCTSIVVDSIVGIADPIRRGGLQPPDTVVKDAEWSSTIIYSPSAAGAFKAPLRVYYHGEDNISHDTLIDVTASAIDPPQLAIGLREGNKDVALHAGELVAIPISWRHAPASVATLGVQSLSFRLTLRTDLLTPIRITVSGGGTSRLQLDRDTCIATIDLPLGYSMPSDSILATIECQTFVTDTFTTTVSLTDLSASATNADCISLAHDTTSLTFTLTPVCTDPTLSHYLTGPPFHVESIVPNPAHDELTIAWWAVTAAAMEVQLCDVLGRPALSQNIGPDVHRTSLQVSALPAGVYYLRLSGGGFVESRRVVIER